MTGCLKTLCQVTQIYNQREIKTLTDKYNQIVLYVSLTCEAKSCYYVVWRSIERYILLDIGECPARTYIPYKSRGACAQ